MLRLWGKKMKERNNRAYCRLGQHIVEISAVSNDPQYKTSPFFQIVGFSLHLVADFDYKNINQKHQFEFDKKTEQI